MKNELIKKPGAQTEFTYDQMMELHRCSKDPIYFMKTYMKVIHPTKGAIPFAMFPYQERMVKGFVENRWSVVLAGRQLGKTTVIAAYLLWFATFNFDKFVLVASKDNDAAIDVMDRIRFGYEELPMWLKAGCVYWNRHEIVFDNKSSIKSSSTTENTGRGRSVSLLMLDELAFVNPQIQQAMWTSLAPTLATGGSCIVSSTPNGDQDLFAELFRGAEAGSEGMTKVGDNGFFPLAVAWNEHPDRNEAYKIAMINKIGEEKWYQEFECKFISSDPLLISSQTLQRLKPMMPIFVDHDFKFWKRLDPKMTYLVGCDVAEGLKKDYSVIQVLELQTMTQVCEFRRNDVKDGAFYKAIKWILELLLSCKDKQTGKVPDILWSYENNAVGAAITALYFADERFPDGPELVTIGSKAGMNTNQQTKAVASRDFKRLLERVNGPLIINSGDLITELKNYVQSGARGTYHARPGATDDCVAAMLIITRLISYVATYEDEAFKHLYETEANFTAETTSEWDEPMPMSVM